MNKKIPRNEKPCGFLVMGEQKLFDTKKIVFHKGMFFLPKSVGSLGITCAPKIPNIFDELSTFFYFCKKLSSSISHKQTYLRHFENLEKDPS